MGGRMKVGIAVVVGTQVALMMIGGRVGAAERSSATRPAATTRAAWNAPPPVPSAAGAADVPGSPGRGRAAAGGLGPACGEGQGVAHAAGIPRIGGARVVPAVAQAE